MAVGNRRVNPAVASTDSGRPSCPHRAIAATDSHVAEVAAWRRRIVEESAFECTAIPFRESREWRFEDGCLTHRTGGFFSLVGVSASSRHPGLDGREQLIILQTRIAINGFLARRGDDGVRLLFHGRVEPGNVGAMQLAPTVQSTETNYKRLHGGGPTPFVEWFTGERPTRTLCDELQSEEATRYHGKYNRNAVLEVPDDVEIDRPDSFRWYGREAIRSFVASDNLLNTDARSVLACMDWDILAGEDAAFASAATDSFAARLQASYRAVPDDAEHSLEELFAWLTRLRVGAGLRTKIIPITELGNWVIEGDCIRERDRAYGFSVRQFRVVARGREVSAWDQPLVDSDDTGRLSLISQVRSGVLHFLLKASHEVGYLEGVQLSTSIFQAPGGRVDGLDAMEQSLTDLVEAPERATVHAACRQSEEGGRFYLDENDYEIVELDRAVEVPSSPCYRWVTLAQIRRMIQIPGLLSIELRNTLALLLAYI